MTIWTAIIGSIMWTATIPFGIWAVIFAAQRWAPKLETPLIYGLLGLAAIATWLIGRMS